MQLVGVCSGADDGSICCRGLQGRGRVWYEREWWRSTAVKMASCQMDRWTCCICAVRLEHGATPQHCCCQRADPSINGHAPKLPSWHVLAIAAAHAEHQHPCMAPRAASAEACTPHTPAGCVCCPPGAPQFFRVCSLRALAMKPWPAVAPALPVGASRYMRDRFRMLPTCRGAGQGRAGQW
jgi:hypothetical protein